MSIDSGKRRAAEAAVALVRSGMTIGLGGGTTVAVALELLADRVRSGGLTDVACITSSRATAANAESLGLRTFDLVDVAEVELTIDGADEIDPALDLIKGAGAELLHEKILAQSTRRLVIIADRSKLSPALGTRAALPVEVFPYGLRAEQRFLTGLGAVAELRMAGASALVTEEGNVILDCRFREPPDAQRIAAALAQRAGVAAHGLFLGLASEVIVGHADGVDILRRTSS